MGCAWITRGGGHLLPGKTLRKVPIIHTDHNSGTHTSMVKWAMSMARAWPLSKTMRQILSRCEHLFGGGGVLCE